MRCSMGTPKGSPPSSSASCVYLARNPTRSTSPDTYGCSLCFKSCAKTSFLSCTYGQSAGCFQVTCQLTAEDADRSARRGCGRDCSAVKQGAGGADLLDRAENALGSAL